MNLPQWTFLKGEGDPSPFLSNRKDQDQHGKDADHQSREKKTNPEPGSLRVPIPSWMAWTQIRTETTNQNKLL